jgi:hypothetical protein
MYRRHCFNGTSKTIIQVPLPNRSLLRHSEGNLRYMYICHRRANPLVTLLGQYKRTRTACTKQCARKHLPR